MKAIRRRGDSTIDDILLTRNRPASGDLRQATSLFFEGTRALLHMTLCVTTDLDKLVSGFHLDSGRRRNRPSTVGKLESEKNS